MSHLWCVQGYNNAFGKRKENHKYLKGIAHPPPKKRCSPTFLKISYFVFNTKKKYTISKWWKNLPFWVNYPFNNIHAIRNDHFKCLCMCKSVRSSVKILCASSIFIISIRASWTGFIQMNRKLRVSLTFGICCSETDQNVCSYKWHCMYFSGYIVECVFTVHCLT